jgi:hypothetical protein
VLAVALSLVLGAFDELWFSDHAAVALVTIAGVTAAGAVASAARQGREKELVNVRAVADVAQRVLLHQVPRRVGRDPIAVRYISAAAAARIGGDLYDVVAVQGATRLIVADVQGKGLAAVQTAAVVLAAFRESAYDAADLVTIAGHIERSLGHQAPGGRFVTAIRSAWATSSPATGRSTPSRSARATACSSTPTGSARPATAPVPSTSRRGTVRAHCWPDRIPMPRSACYTTTFCDMSAVTCTMTRRPCSSCGRERDGRLLPTGACAVSPVCQWRQRPL